MSALQTINIVLVGDNFPVASIDLTDFSFRGRAFTEQLRVGPALQAESRNVHLFFLPDRLQIGIKDPDNLDILTEGLREVLMTFTEYVGRRVLTSMGHNAQALFTEPGGAERVLSDLVAKGVAADLLGMASRPEAQLVLQGKVGQEKAVRVTVSGDDEQNRGLLDFNFDFPINREQTFEMVLDQIRPSLAHAEQIARNFASQYGKVLR